VLAFGLIALFVFLNGFFVAAEFALVKLRATQLERLARRTDASARVVVDVSQRLDRYLSATQLGITLASLGLGSVGEPAITHGFEHLLTHAGITAVSERALHSIALVFGFSVLTAAHIIFGELVPKLVAIRSAEGVALAVARPLRVFYWLVFPGLIVLNAASSLLLRTLGYPSLHDTEGALSEEEILGVLSQAYAKGRLSQPKRQLLERVIRFTERTVRQVMVPRVDVSWLDDDLTLDQALQRARAAGFTRFPLAENGDLDRVVGYINLKDVVMALSRPATLREVMREALVVPETLGVFEAMREMQQKQVPFAVVVDEYGGTSGIVTLEDVLEEIVGEIRDEHDEEAPKIEVRGDGSLVVDGLIALDDLRTHGIDLAGSDADTVGGAVLAHMGRFARAGDTVVIDGWQFRVEAVRRRRVARVTVRKVATLPRSEPEA
jgi:CBS domain containing-hemolysin-like protein